MASKTEKIAATPTAISPLYGRVSEKSNAVRAKLPAFRLSGENSEMMSRKSVGTYEEPAIRKFRIADLEAAMGLKNDLSRWNLP